MNAGKLDKRIDIMRRVETRDNTGDDISDSESANWRLVRTVWARWQPLSGRELTEAKQIQPDTPSRVRMRYTAGSDITTNDRIRYRGVMHDITDVIDPVGAHEEIVLMLLEVRPYGGN